MKKAFLICIAMLSVNIGMALELPPTELELKANKEDFQRVSILKSVLEHCQNPEVLEVRGVWQSVIIEYSQYVIFKNNIKDEEVASVIAGSEIAVINKFGEVVPLNICSQALEKSNKLTLDWSSFKKKKEEPISKELKMEKHIRLESVHVII